MIAAFGATDHPIAQGEDPSTLGTLIANAVITYQLDGVDIDHEETSYLTTAGSGANWLCTLTNAIRAQFNNYPNKEYLLSIELYLST